MSRFPHQPNPPFSQPISSSSLLSTPSSTSSRLLSAFPPQTSSFEANPQSRLSSPSPPLLPPLSPPLSPSPSSSPSPPPPPPSSSFSLSSTTTNLSTSLPLPGTFGNLPTAYRTHQHYYHHHRLHHYHRSHQQTTTTTTYINHALQLCMAGSGDLMEIVLDVPTCTKNDVIIRVVGTGVCTGDLKVLKGERMYKSRRRPPNQQEQEQEQGEEEEEGSRESGYICWKNWKELDNKGDKKEQEQEQEESWYVENMDDEEEKSKSEEKNRMERIDSKHRNKMRNRTKKRKKKKNIKKKWNCIPGMEIRGIVEEIGSNVIHLSIGDEVICNPYFDNQEKYSSQKNDDNNDYYHPECYERHNRNTGHDGRMIGNDNHIDTIDDNEDEEDEEGDILGITRDGGWQQYVCIPQSMVFKVESDLKQSSTWSSLVFELSKITQAYSIVSNSVNHMKRILVVNGGIVALMWAIFLREKGVEPTLCNQIHETRQLAKQLKFDAFTSSNIDAQIKDTGRIYDLVIECSGRPEQLRHCAQWLNPYGLILRCDCLPHKQEIIPGLTQHLSEIEIQHSFGCSSKAFREAMAMAAKLSHKYAAADLGVRKYSISDYGAGIRAMQNEKICKALFFLTDPRARRFLVSPSAPLLCPSTTPYGIEIPQLSL